jgi:phosphoglycolate phosphatase
LSHDPPRFAGATIVFDLDGTLVDSAPDLIASLNHVLVSENRLPLAPETVRMIVGHGARALIERGFAETGDAVPPERLSGLVTRFVDYYSAHIAEGTRPFPGVEAALARLAAEGAQLAVLTNKFEGLAVQVIRTLRLEAHFATIVGADTLAVRKPDPESYFETVRRAGGIAGRSVMVGDSPTDVATARAAQVPMIGVTFGYTPVPPTEFGADALIDHFDALDDALGALLPRR